MKKVLLGLLITAFLLSAASCVGGVSTPTADPNAPSNPEEEYEREDLFVYIDGRALKEDGYKYNDLKKFMTGREIGGQYYFGAYLPQITKENLSSVKGAFLEAGDGYVCYVPEIDGLFVAAYASENGEFQSINRDGNHQYDGVLEDGFVNKGLNRIYLVSTSSEFTVEIQKNGQTIGELGLGDFMTKTPLGEQKISTAMFDGSFMYDGGASTYKGRFLGISYRAMLAKLAALDMDLSGNITEVEYYGTNGLGKEGKNLEYSITEGDDKYFGSVDFSCMFDGRTFNDVSAGCPLGLTAFINGTGGRWMTHNLSVINFIVEQP